MGNSMNSTRRKLISQMKGFSPIYCLFYYTDSESGEIKIFSGGKFYPITQEEANDGGFLIPVDGKQREREEVIKKYEGLG